MDEKYNLRRPLEALNNLTLRMEKQPISKQNYARTILSVKKGAYRKHELYFILLSILSMIVQ